MDLLKFALSALLFAAGCQKLRVAECTFTCESDNSCAAGLVCGADGYCHGDGKTTGCAALTANDGGAPTCADGGTPCALCANPCGPYNYAFVTSRTFTPGATHSDGGTTFKNVDEASAICNELAHAASATAEVRSQATYVAWISDSTHNAIDAIRNSQGWIRPDGKPFANSATELTNSNIIYHPLRIDETRTDIATQGSLNDIPSVLTGTSSAGQNTGINASNWTAPAGAYSFGKSSATIAAWTQFGGNTRAIGMGAPPDSGDHLYCFGVGRQTPLKIAPPGGRHAFVSSGSFTPGTSGGYDQFCQSEAASVGFNTNFKAFVAIGNASAASRFDEVDGGNVPWLRPDGIPWMESYNDLVNAMAQTTLDVTYNQSMSAFGDVADTVWTGADNAKDSTTVGTCNSWAAASGTTVIGDTRFSDLSFFNVTTGVPCSGSNRLYCLEF